ncbi:hypothetical protein LTR10_018590 [Elasticomyces elasticus]|uniref:Nucleoporin Nup54 alpha-helical domain-containing protein n=1 Tax=Exophiala sideris TaxID=1016849 RepID=A0ABR0J0B8_9EURO|nr:hypothetical protein LTR10_018590 [Elasticomyces elasticus]KAK5023230.1 hypothetical protein LTS07_009452 [Exophiala sideris]KAK5028602.1 hypothetical protein LTR13_009053 [Exophiala sideris]KAK5052980.1 hypothetical protein LTR69_009549 [Exophiala sideris]KAK5178720.1 hypothetical protein LTR44_008834 [Eurotiomycetes sp. CCFEE 6388]
MSDQGQQDDIVISLEELNSFTSEVNEAAIEDATWVRFHGFLRQFYPDITMEDLKRAKHFQREPRGQWWKIEEINRHINAQKSVDLEWLWKAAAEQQWSPAADFVAYLSAEFESSVEQALTKLKEVRENLDRKIDTLRYQLEEHLLLLRSGVDPVHVLYSYQAELQALEKHWA